MGPQLPAFATFFQEVTGFKPRAYQEELARRLVAGEPPRHLDVPTGMGKTWAIVAGWLYALAVDVRDARQVGRPRRVPLRLHYVVDRRAVVDDAYATAVRLHEALASPTGPATAGVARLLREAFPVDEGLLSGDPSTSTPGPLEVLRVRGGLDVEQRRHAGHTRYPARPVIAVATLDMAVSRLLFRGYHLAAGRRSIDAALTGADAFWVLDEAHLARQAATTLSVLTDRESALEDRFSGAVPGLQVMVMTATRGASVPGTAPEPAPDQVMRMSWEVEGRRDPLVEVRRRQREDTTLQVRMASTGDQATALAGRAVHLASALGPGASLIVFCNTVGAAKKVDGELRKAAERAEKAARSAKRSGAPAAAPSSVPPRPVLLIGAMPERYKEHALDALEPFRTGNPRRDDARPVVVVATSTLEVGADLDFTYLITEACQADSLVQRLGRVNRVGARQDGSAEIIRCRGKEDPVHGPAADAVTGLLKGAGTVGEALSRLERAEDQEALRARQQVPILLPPMVLASYVRTEGSRNDPPVGPFIRQLQETRAEVSIVFRDSVAVMATTAQEALCEDLATDPPDLNAEAWSVSVTDAMSIKRSALGHGPVVVIDPVGAEAPHVATSSSDAGGVEPGQTLVIGTSGDGAARGMSLLGISDAGHDLSGQVVLEGATLSSVSTALARLASQVRVPARTGTGFTRTPPLLTDLGGEQLDEDSEDPRVRADCLDEIVREVEVPDGWVLEPELLGVEARRPWLRIRLVRVPDRTDDRRRAGFRDVLLSDHNEAVGERARTWARTIGVPEEVAADIALAGAYHDRGKGRTAAFQTALAMDVDPAGNLFLPDDRTGSGTAPVPLAKSRLPRRYWRRAARLAGVLDGWRHEAASADCLTEDLGAGVTSAHDPDLVVHLVLTHHGHFRGPGPVCTAQDGTSARHQDPTAPEWIDAIERFHRLNDRYGPYTLALAEAVLRLADWSVSAGHDVSDDHLTDHGRLTAAGSADDAQEEGR